MKSSLVVLSTLVATSFAARAQFSTPTSLTPSFTPTTTLPLRPTRRPTKSPTKAPTAKPTTRSPTVQPTTTLTPSTLPPTSTTAPTPAPPSSLTGMQGQLISQTNKIRAAHGLGPVTWDAALSAEMQAYANSCPGFNHGGPSGWQNLATNTACSGDACLNIVGAAWLWYNQEETKWNYDGNTCNGDLSTCVTSPT
ncbi:hypothetical protein Ae201684P_001513 [Aphanomyces euteiches]|uniref:SCP domain-containing protein n=1 Tax=Aphanomyces euteiches TaxID=100861 RepID=A0A6G0WTW7_9STRA|nr:hypothetical protein Ae201684_011773 [Aphanomyces euteiches]KAH9089312.1 hypothetical protein Ae201684P_001513 [Aphanomyces euteiches]KAH9141406.1 hypothetical protein AeRB84_014413 [Aphanomyces euteiches]